MGTDILKYTHASCAFGISEFSCNFAPVKDND
jgi:hypothetical protein